MIGHKHFKGLNNIRDLSVRFVGTGLNRDYPQFYKLLVLILTLPVTTATVERAFSSLKFIKNYLRTTIADEWLDDLMLMYINNAYVIDHNNVLDNFIKMKHRRCNFGKGK